MIQTCLPCLSDTDIDFNSVQQHHNCLQELLPSTYFSYLNWLYLSFSNGYLFIVSGYALVGYVSETFVVVDEFECQQKCTANKRCKSFNVRPDDDFTRHICELNNKTRQKKPGDFVKTKASSYYGSVKVSDSSDRKNTFKSRTSNLFNLDRLRRLQTNKPCLIHLTHHFGNINWYCYMQSTPDNSNLQLKLKKVRSSYREFEVNNRR